MEGTEKTIKKPLKKALTVANVINQKVKLLKFENQFHLAFGQPQDRGVWFIWGGSASGKSSFVMQLAKEMAGNLKVFYNVLEEEPDDHDFMKRVMDHRIENVQHNLLVGNYQYDDLVVYLERKNSPDVVIIDSLVYFTKSFEDYIALKKKFKNKIFIFTGHANGKLPRTDLELRIMYDAKMKIFVDGYLATCKGRTIGANGGLYIIWKEGYEKIRGTKNN